MIFRRNGAGEKKWSVSESPEWVCAKFKFTNGTVHRYPKVATSNLILRKLINPGFVGKTNVITLITFCEMIFSNSAKTTNTF